ncbi:MAG: hypothetical protein ACOYBQ_08465 [Fluviibacter sp.]
MKTNENEQHLEALARNRLLLNKCFDRVHAQVKAVSDGETLAVAVASLTTLLDINALLIARERMLYGIG